MPVTKGVDTLQTKEDTLQTKEHAISTALVDLDINKAEENLQVPGTESIDVKDGKRPNLPVTINYFENFLV